MDRLVIAFAQGIIRFRFLVLALALAASGLAGWGTASLRFDTDYRAYFSSQNPELVAFESLQNVFNKQDNILFVLVPGRNDIFTKETLGLVENLTREAWQMPFARRVDSITNFQHTYAEGDDLIVTDLVENARTLGADEIAAVRDVALGEPLLVNRLIAPGGGATGVNVILQLPGKDSTTEVPQSVAFARDLADRFRAAHPGIDIRLTGSGMLSNAFPEASMADMTILIPIMYGVLIVALMIFLRSLSGTAVTLLIVFLSSLVAVGAAGWAGIKLTPPSATAPTVIMTLAMADCVHILVSMFHEMRHGKSKDEAIVESLRINMEPVFLTSLTTAIGFLSMNTSDSPPFHDLGNLTAIGVAVAFVFSITVLPAAVSILPLRRVPQTIGLYGAMAWLSDCVCSRWRRFFWGALAGMAVLAAFIPRIELNDNFIDYFDPRIPFRADTDFAGNHLTGMLDIQYPLQAAEPGGIAEPVYLETLNRFAEWFRGQPGVIHVNSLADVMKRLNRNMHGDNPEFYRLPESRELASQYLLLYELSLPLGLDLTDQVNLDKSATRLTVTLKKMSTRKVREMENRAQVWLAANAPRGMARAGTGANMMFTHITERNIKSMLGGAGFAIILIAAALTLTLRSLSYGLLSMIPNAMPAVMAFGLWGLFVGEVGLAASVISVMTLGIVVDDTVHFLSKYLRARRERGHSPVEAVKYAFSTVGAALVTTSAVLAAGFGVLAFSSFKVNAEMGLLSAITIVFALAIDLLFLPTLLLRFTPGSRKAGPEGTTG
ncbi:MAG: MMPL family transporter [Rhodospirillales bacterium]|nr:MMPL family transporter [Rhodospirillales bacterium]